MTAPQVLDPVASVPEARRASWGRTALTWARKSKELQLSALWSTLAWASSTAPVAIALYVTAGLHLTVTVLSTFEARLRRTRCGRAALAWARRGKELQLVVLWSTLAWASPTAPVAIELCVTAGLHLTVTVLDLLLPVRERRHPHPKHGQDTPPHVGGGLTSGSAAASQHDTTHS